MIEKIKLYAYGVLAILAIWFGYGFYSSYREVTRKAAETATNEVSRPTPPPVTNAVASTNSPATGTNDLTSSNATTTNAAANPTNMVAASNTPTPPAPAPTADSTDAPPKHKGSQGTMIGYMAAFIGAIIGLGLLIASDVTQYMGTKTVDFLFDDDGDGARDPEYENAEKVWANGKPLEAIQMMRDYLKDHPREQYVALRIAEIYEKDLRNYLAAALEYEEVLKKKIEPERWGWAAIHLCNLYSKMGQQDKTVALLEKIIEKHPETAAAKKAREKLGVPEVQPAAPPAPSEPVPAAPEQPIGAKPKRIRVEVNKGDPEKPEKPKEPEKPKLPPGFRPKE